MNSGALRMLLVEDNPLDAHVVHAMLAEADTAVAIEAAGELQEALTALGERPFDVILLDLSLPDARGLEALGRVRAYAPNIPVVVLTGRDDQSVALQAVGDGAQDYLTKERMDGDVLLRSLRYAVERHRLVVAIRELSLTDELTQLYNRRGFFTVAEQRLIVAAREQQQIALFYADLDGLKQINDRLGHRDGDRAITEAADVLRETFRASDTPGRIGGDEFVVLAVGVDADRAAAMLQRLGEKVEGRNGAPGRSYALSLSTGLILNDPGHPASIDHLVTCADAAMYERKRHKHRTAPRAAATLNTPVLT